MARCSRSVDRAQLEALDGGGAPPNAHPSTLPSFTYFPANRSITFHIGLIGCPTDIRTYLSFSPDVDATVAPAAGNQTLIRKRTKDEIVIHNDTCSEFWVWLTASTSATPFHPVPAGDAGTDPSEAAGATGTP